MYLDTAYIHIYDYNIVSYIIVLCVLIGMYICVCVYIYFLFQKIFSDLFKTLWDRSFCLQIKQS